MILAIVFVFWSSGLAERSPARPVPRSSACVGALAGASKEFCLGDEQVRLADAAPKGSAQRSRRLQTAAAHYRKAASRTSNFELAERALDTLVTLYDPEHLNESDRMELVWQELIALRMGLIGLGDPR